MRKPRLLVGLCAVLALGVWTATAMSDPPPPDPLPICPGGEVGTPISGSHNGGLTITGNVSVPAGSQLTVNGGLTVAPGACFNAVSTATVRINGGVKVGNGAIFGLGYFFATGDRVNGGINADHPLTMYLDWLTVNGGVTSNGGGNIDLVDPNGIEFVVKDNKINGGVTVQGWSGAWIGLIRNTVNGSVTFSKNSGTRLSEDSTPVPDSSEVVDNRISGNLTCYDNTPHAQLGDSGGGKNTVSGHAFGECATLVK
jgi:hypothetical protein